MLFMSAWLFCDEKVKSTGIFTHVRVGAYCLCPHCVRGILINVNFRATARVAPTRHDNIHFSWKISARKFGTNTKKFIPLSLNKIRVYLDTKHAEKIGWGYSLLKYNPTWRTTPPMAFVVRGVFYTLNDTYFVQTLQIVRLGFLCVRDASIRATHGQG